MTIAHWKLSELANFLTDHGFDLLLQHGEDKDGPPWLALRWLQHEATERKSSRHVSLCHAIQDVLMNVDPDAVRAGGDEPRATAPTDGGVAGARQVPKPPTVGELASMLGIHDALIQVPSFSDRPWVVTLWRRGAPYVRACSTADDLDEALDDALEQMSTARDEYDEDPNCI